MWLCSPPLLFCVCGFGAGLAPLQYYTGCEYREYLSPGTVQSGERSSTAARARKQPGCSARGSVCSIKTVHREHGGFSADYVQIRDKDTRLRRWFLWRCGQENAPHRGFSLAEVRRGSARDERVVLGCSVISLPVAFCGHLASNSMPLLSTSYNLCHDGFKTITRCDQLTPMSTISIVHNRFASVYK